MTTPSPRPAELLRRLLIAAVIGVSALDAWFYRQWNLNPDGVSYFDIARAFVEHGPAALINGYWSPLYPATIGLGMQLFSPGPDWSYPLVRAIGFIVAVIAVLAFDRLIRTVVASNTELQAAHDTSHWTALTFLTALWALFFLLVTQAIGMHLATPDMGVAAIVFFVAAELTTLASAPWSAARWSRLGVCLGVGYWWKAILFPVAGVAFALAGWIVLRRRDPWKPVIAGASAFAVVAMLIAVPVSLLVGRPTFGETGRLNHLWFVSNVPAVATLCISPEGRLNTGDNGTVPTEPVLLAHPLTCGTRELDPEATLPLWYDPSPWYANATNHLRGSEFAVAVRNNIEYIRAALAESLPVAAIALGLALAGALGAAATARRVGSGWPAVALGAMPIAAYVIVYVELRHIVPFLLCMSVWALATLIARRTPWALALVVVVAIGAGIDGVRRIATQQRVELAITLHELQGAPRPEQVSVRVARELRARGLEAGDRVATVNTLWNVDWAQRAGLAVRAYIPELTYPLDRTFEQLQDPCRLASFQEAMRKARIRAVILKDVDLFASPTTFAPLGDTGYRLLLVGATPPPPASCDPTRLSSGTAAH